jgi:hypothetical protein
VLYKNFVPSVFLWTGVTGLALTRPRVARLLDGLDLQEYTDIGMCEAQIDKNFNKEPREESGSALLLHKVPRTRDV